MTLTFASSNAVVNRRHLAFSCLLSLSLMLGASVARADEAAGQCLDCHTASADTAVHAVFNTVHGAVNGGGEESCTSCHGDSPGHQQNPGDTSPDISYGPRWQSSAAARDGSCQQCHEKGNQLLWTGSVHQGEELGCDSCHDSHTQLDPALNDGRENQLCTACHAPVRAQSRLPSHHPIEQGKTACVDCHNPHGSMSEGELHQVSLNDNCLSCHQEKRGPFLWEHAPVAEDCALCHRPHGSVNNRLLTARGPALCQQCHAAAFHPSLPYGSEGLAGGAPNQNLLGKNCLNCHSQIHGSNHPSGARLTR